MTLQALVYDPRGASDKWQFIEIWLDHYHEPPFFFYSSSSCPTQILPQGSLQSPAKSTHSSHSSLGSSLSTSLLSTRLDSGPKARAKCVRGATKTSAQPLKWTKRAVSNSSPWAEIDVEANNHLSDDHASADVLEVIDADSVDDDELERDLGTSHNYSFFTSLVTSISS
jgi:hypothetical protein